MRAIAALSLMAMFSSIPAAYAAGSSDTESVMIHVLANGWHAGVLLPAEGLNALVPGLRERFPKASQYEVGWGDVGFYQAKEITVGLAFEALFASKGAVLHVVAVPEPIRDFLRGSDVAVSCFSPAQYQRMVQTVAASFVLDRDGKPVARGVGIYGNSQFYEAQGRYGLLHTCNRWTATVLEAGGLPIHPSISLTASSVMSAARTHGRACTVQSEARRPSPP